MKKIPALLLLIIAFACSSDVYDTQPLAVTGFNNPEVSYAFKYRKGSLYLFTLTTGGAVTTTKTFYVSNGNLSVIHQDSTSTGYIKTTPYYEGAVIVRDSTFAIAGTTRTLKSVNEFGYDANNHLGSVKQSVWTAGVKSVSYIDLTWTGENVTKLILSADNSGVKTLQSEITVTHDDKKCVFGNSQLYFYALKPAELYWLSENNPVSFVNGSGTETKSTYWYNQFELPSNFKTAAGVLYSCTYKELR